MNISNSKWLNQLKKEKWLLLLCIVLAFFAWQTIRRNIGFELPVYNIAVDVDVPEGWAVWDKSIHKVNITFLGSREDIRFLNNEQLRVVIPVVNPERGKEIVIELSSKYLKNPTGARVMSFSPSEIVVKLDQETERLLPVKAAVNGSLPDGLEIERIVCTPATVRVAGAKQALDEMENIRTVPIELKGRQTSFKESAPIALPATGRMRAEPDWVTVEFALEMRSNTATFDKVPIRVLSPAAERRGIDVQPKTIGIVVRGQQQRLDQMRPGDVFAYVNCTELAERTGYDLPVVVDLPSGLQLIKAEPAVVHVEIGKTNQEFP